MGKKPHPADIAAEEQMIAAIRAADHFMASIFIGAGQYEKRTGETLKEAIVKAKLLMSSRRFNARPIYYAVAKDGRATMLTLALIERLTGWKV